MLLLDISFILYPISGLNPQKTTKKEEWIGIFMPNMQNIITCILSKLLNRFQRSLQNNKDHEILFVRGSNMHTTNPRWWTAAFWTRVQSNLAKGSITNLSSLISSPCQEWLEICEPNFVWIKFLIMPDVHYYLRWNAMQPVSSSLILVTKPYPQNGLKYQVKI